MRSELLIYQFVPMQMNTVVQSPYVSSPCSIFLGNASKMKAHLAGRYVHRETYRLIS